MRHSDRRVEAGAARRLVSRLGFRASSLGTTGRFHRRRGPFDRSDRIRSPRLAVVSFAFTGRNPARAIRIARISCGFRACRVVARLTDKVNRGFKVRFCSRGGFLILCEPSNQSHRAPACFLPLTRKSGWILTDESRTPSAIPAHETLSHHLQNQKMAVLQVNALFKKAAPAPAKKAAPAKKGLFTKKAAPAPKKAAPKKAAPVKKTSGKPSQAGSDPSKWYGTYLLLPPRSPYAKTRVRHQQRHPRFSRLARARSARHRHRAARSDR